jgi:carboxyl-terminal processing protease
MNDGGGVPTCAPRRAGAEARRCTNELKEAKEAVEKPVFYTSSGRIVYRGGGITPDIEYTPREYTDLMRRLERDGLGFSFAIDYLKSHQITEEFKTTDAILADFYKFLATKKFEYKKEDLTPENVDYIRNMIAREAVNNKYGRKAMYRWCSTPIRSCRKPSDDGEAPDAQGHVPVRGRREERQEGGRHQEAITRGPTNIVPPACRVPGEHDEEDCRSM